MTCLKKMPFQRLEIRSFEAELQRDDRQPSMATHPAAATNILIERLTCDGPPRNHQQIRSQRRTVGLMSSMNGGHVTVRQRSRRPTAHHLMSPSTDRTWRFSMKGATVKIGITRHRCLCERASAADGAPTNHLVPGLNNDVQRDCRYRIRAFLSAAQTHHMMIVSGESKKHGSAPSKP